MLAFTITKAARLVRLVTSSSMFEMGRPASAGWQRALRGRCARDAYVTDEFNFPERIAELDEQEIAIVGYMIPLEWEDTKVPEFMLVRDLLGCCFGGAPQPDEWMEVVMEGEGADYFPYIPVLVTGTLSVEGIEDEAGYAAGCFVLSGTSVTKEF